jgi:hypothetical protein
VYVCFGRGLGYVNGVWQDVHGAGCQRSDPKAGDPGEYPYGHGPQGDAIRILNYVRLVRGPAAPAGCPGDSNCDEHVDWRDIDYFVAAMTSQAAWEAMLVPGALSCSFDNNDVNHDGQANWHDIDPFVAEIGSICP